MMMVAMSVMVHTISDCGGAGVNYNTKEEKMNVVITVLRRRFVSWFFLVFVDDIV